MAMDWNKPRINVLELPAEFRNYLIEAMSPDLDKKFNDLTADDIAEIVNKHHMTTMTPMEALSMWLEYEGFIGYNEKIRRLIDALIQKGMDIGSAMV